MQGQFSIFLSGFNVKRDIHTGCARVLESEWNVISVEGMTARVMYLFIIVLSEPGKFYIATYRSLEERRLAIIFRKVYIIFENTVYEFCRLSRRKVFFVFDCKCDDISTSQYESTK